MRNGHNFEFFLAQILAHSAVFFSGEDWAPVRDARMDGKDTSTADETTSQEQVGGEGGAAGSSTVVAGAGAVNSGNSGLITGRVGNNSEEQVNITSDDPAAIEGISDVADTALAGNVTLAQSALEYEAQSSGEADSVAYASEALSAQALQQANQQQADNAGTIESLSAEYAAGLSEAESNDQITEADVAAGQSQALNTGLSQPSTGLNKLALWLGLAASAVCVWAFLRRKKE